MTTEVAIMNRRAVVLAADSAGTVTSWLNGKQEVRYFKGENKVFQLSEHHPIGLMTFANAHIQHLPWDILIKEFRRELGADIFDSVGEYAEHLFAYLEANRIAFPLEEREGAFREKISQQILRIGIEAGSAVDFESPHSPEQLSAQVRAQIEDRLATLEAQDLHPAFTQGDIDKAETDLAQEADSIVQRLFEGTKLDLLISMAPLLLTVAINLIHRNPADVGSSTGIVVAGYGRTDLFPRLIEYRVLGFVREKLLFSRISSVDITARAPGAIRSFATTAMVDTFVVGVPSDVYASVNRAFEATAHQMISDLERQLSGRVPDPGSIISKQREAFVNRWFGEAITAHKQPLDSVVSMLAVDEMANLAETLVTLEAVKEKVTRPTESIGGPVDVAAITKAEGLVWIKRKHFFDLALNARYQARVGRRGGTL